jgi:molybdopterin molybdotransferase
MLTVDEAMAIVLSEVTPGRPVRVPLRQAYGLVLADDVCSRCDSPVFDKAQMDGYAVRSADVTAGESRLRIIEEVTAGRTPQRAVGPGEATRIMTGAPVPEGADAVAPVEWCRCPEGSGEILVDRTLASGTYVIPRGSSMRSGEVVLRAGVLLQAAQLGLLAELGETDVVVWQRPRVAILATGNELVPFEETPGSGQIRNSNELMLWAQVTHAGAEPVSLGIAADESWVLQQKIAEGLACEVLCLSGGVSAGKLDLVPGELHRAGVRQIFHKVHMKPGKPVWFGKLDADRSPDGLPRWIFGLPGNPVSSMVCFDLFVRAALRRLQGLSPAGPQRFSARLSVDFHYEDDRPTCFPARVEWTVDGPTVRPVTWRGSFDLRGASQANALLDLPAGDHRLSAGERVSIYVW